MIHILLHEFLYFVSGILKRPCVLLDDTYIAAVCLNEFFYFDSGVLKRPCVLLDDTYIAAVDVYLDWYHSAVLLHQQRTWLTYFFFLSSDPLMHNHLLLSVLFALFKHYLHTSIISIFYMINLADVLPLSSDGLINAQTIIFYYLHSPARSLDHILGGW